ncbi:MAG: glycoside hydrolase family 127 protein [Bacteroidetes bacterium]|nr:glycoside hydrolase family 127 protein [Bacteroidota bacterium]
MNTGSPKGLPPGQAGAKARKFVFYLLFLFYFFNSNALLAQGYVTIRNDSRVAVKPVVPILVYGFDLKDVRLLDGSPFKNAMDKDAAYLLTVDPKRLLHRFYLNAGLPPQGDVYGGWESEGLSGHTLGHYLSACAMMYASTGNVQFKERTDCIIDELEKCQLARTSGYVGAIPNEDSIFWKVQHGIIKSSGFDLNGGWSPWYTVHKVMAGLTDAFLFADNKKALGIVEKMADWTASILKDLNDEQLETMRKCEYGGIGDVFTHLYEITGKKKYIDLSYKFHDHFILDELAKKIDPMPGKHSNTNVPKAIGCARRHELTANESDKIIARFFWETMVYHHSYVIGGNSNYEYCGQEDKLNDRLSDATCETCNTYNMLKLTRHLFSLQPSSKLTDYYERALYNHILASQNPQTGMMCYFVPLRMGAKKEFSDPFNTFTCCVGSGMENHAKYTEGIYSEAKDGGLYVNLFIPSELNWKSKNTTVTLSTSFPANGEVSITIKSATTQSFPLRIRKPSWAKDKVMISVNGKAVKPSITTEGYFEISRTWSLDEVKLIFPMSLHSESMPDNPNRIALLYGPIVLAGKLGKEMPDPVYGTTVLLTSNHNISDWTKHNSHSLEFTTIGVAKPTDVMLIPFYSTYDQYYNVYWDFFTPTDWANRQKEYEAEKKRIHDVELRTIDICRIGEMQPERDHKLKASEKSYVSDALGRMGREVRSGGFFSFEIKVDPSVENNLLCTYIGDDKNRSFDLLIDEKQIATQELQGNTAGRFFDVEYSIPFELIKGKSKVEAKVQAHINKTAGRVFGCRTLRK